MIRPPLTFYIALALVNFIIGFTIATSKYKPEYIDCMGSLTHEITKYDKLLKEYRNDK